MSTYYTTAQEIRDLLGLEIDDAPNDVLENFILKAQKVILHYIQIQVLDEEIALDISGTTFSLSHKFLADTNFDQVIDSNDLEMYGWTDSSNIETRTKLTASTLWPDQGIVKLDADASGYEKVTVSYSYYTCKIDWDLIGMASAYYAGMLWVAKEEFLVPEELTIGNVRVRQRQPWERLRNEFLRMIYHATSIPMDIVAYRKIMRSPRLHGKFLGPGTTYELDEDQTGVNPKDIS